MSVCLHYEQAGLTKVGSSGGSNNGKGAMGRMSEEGGLHGASDSMGAPHAPRMGQHGCEGSQHGDMGSMSSNLNMGGRMGLGLSPAGILEQATPTKAPQQCAPAASTAPVAGAANGVGKVLKRVDAPMSVALYRELMLAAYLWYLLGVIPILYMVWEGVHAKWF